MKIFNVKKMKNYIRKTLFLIVVLLVLKTPIISIAGNIVYPWNATTAIVEWEDNLTILFDNIYFQMIDSIELVGPFNRLSLSADSVEIGKFEFDNYTKSSVNNRILVKIPKSTPQELYDLFVHCGGEVSSSPKSVKVVKQLNRIHSFIHISDLHMTRQWVGSAENGYAKELELFDSFVKVANIISPDFIIVTGDNIMDYTMFDADSTGWGGVKNYNANKRPLIEEKYKNLFYGTEDFSGIYGLNSPTFLIPGNHDYYGVPKDNYYAKALQWNKLMGIRVHEFSYSGTRVFLADDSLCDSVSVSFPLSKTQENIFEKYLEKNGVGKIRILAQHRPNNVDTMFLNKNNINILLHGHNHSPNEEFIGATPTLSSRPGVICRSGEINNWEKNLGFFRIFHIDGDSFESTLPLRFCKNPIEQYKNLKLNLTLDFQQPNDGAVRSNEAIIANSFPVDLPNCKIRFLMKKGLYEVTGGEIIQTFDNERYSIIDVSVVVNSNEEKIVRVFLLD